MCEELDKIAGLVKLSELFRKLVNLEEQVHKQEYEIKQLKKCNGFVSDFKLPIPEDIVSMQEIDGKLYVAAGRNIYIIEISNMK